MTDTAQVQSFERVTDDNGEGVLVKVDEVDGTLVESENYPPCGDDSPPLPTDFAALKESTASGTLQVVGYVDPKNKGKALGGEKRIFARDASGVPVAELWMNVTEKVIDVQGLAPGWKYRFGKLEIDEDGNLTTPGEITAMNGSPGTSVTLSQHLHPTGTGPSGPPQPGT